MVSSSASPPLPPAPASGAGSGGASGSGSGAASGRDGRSGLLYGLGAYGLWGILPLYFILLEPAGAVEVVANRVVWSLLFCAVLLSATRSWPMMAAAVRSPRLLGTLALAATLIAVNWTAYAWGIFNGHIIETSLGYFINPLVSILLGVIVLKERLRPLQWVAVGIGGAAVVVLTIAYGRPPWLALLLAASFGLYGFVKNRVGSGIDAVSSLSVETLLLAPVAGAVMIWLGVSGTATLTTAGPEHFWLLAASGLITALPLVFFGAAARRLPLSTIGLLQYLAPMLQFLLAILVLGEHMPLSRWIGFGFVWLALVFLTIDMVSVGRRNAVFRRRAARGTAGAAAKRSVPRPVTPEAAPAPRAAAPPQTAPNPGARPAAPGPADPTHPTAT